MNKKHSEKLKLRNFEARQNAVGFFDLLLKIDKRNNQRSKITRAKLSFQILFQIPLQVLISIVFIIFAIQFMLKDNYFYSLSCLILLFLYNQKLKKLTIKTDSLSMECFDPENHKNKAK